MSKIAEIGTENFNAEVLNAPTPVVADFYAPWCGPCRMLTPLLQNLAARYDGRVKFVKVNVDNAPELADRYGITGVPTLILFQGGTVQDTMVGLPSQRALQRRLDELAAPRCCHCAKTADLVPA
jgi:thioredoxin 1